MFLLIIVDGWAELALALANLGFRVAGPMGILKFLGLKEEVPRSFTQLTNLGSNTRRAHVLLIEKSYRGTLQITLCYAILVTLPCV